MKMMIERERGKFKYKRWRCSSERMTEDLSLLLGLGRIIHFDLGAALRLQLSCHLMSNLSTLVLYRWNGMLFFFLLGIYGLQPNQRMSFAESFWEVESSRERDASRRVTNDLGSVLHDLGYHLSHWCDNLGSTFLCHFCAKGYCMCDLLKGAIKDGQCPADVEKWNLKGHFKFCCSSQGQLSNVRPHCSVCYPTVGVSWWGVSLGREREDVKGSMERKMGKQLTWEIHGPQWGIWKYALCGSVWVKPALRMVHHSVFSILPQIFLRQKLDLLRIKSGVRLIHSGPFMTQQHSWTHSL